MAQARSRWLVPVLLLPVIPLAFGAGKVKDPLRDLLSAVAARLDHGEPAVRATAAEALGKLGPHLRTDLTAEAAATLGRKVDHADHGMTMGVAQNQRDPGTRVACLGALGQLSAHLQGPALDGLRRALACRLDDKEPEVRAAAVAALGQVAGRLEGEALGEACKAAGDALGDKEAKVRAAAVGAIVQCAARLKALGAYPAAGTKP